MKTSRYIMALVLFSCFAGFLLGLTFTKNTKLENRDNRLVHEHTNATSLVPKPAVQPFHWAQVESSDYREYIRNMRLIGVPEQTIRDIVIADVNSLFASKLSALKQLAAEQTPFWTASRELSSRARIPSSILQEVDKLNREKRYILEELLGSGVPLPDDLHIDVATVVDPLGFLPEEKRPHVASIEQLHSAHLLGITSGPHREREWHQAVRDKDRQLETILSPEEKREYDLRKSQTATLLRSELEYFAPTESEFRAIFEIRDRFEKEILDARLGEDTAFDSLPADYQERLDKMENALKSVLGEDRYLDYKMSRDGTYRTAVDFAQSNGLSPVVAKDIFRIRQQIGREYQTHILERNLAAPERQQALAGLYNATVGMLQQSLGEQLSSDYLRGQSGAWVGDILRGVMPAPPSP